MLIVHPSSTCDICLDGYNWTTPANAPHAIACGHVFCLRCLRLLSPSTCPLCRKAFQPDRIKKLHVDRLATGNDDDDRTQAEEFELIQHVALFFGENTPDEDVNTVLGEVHDWLALQGDNPSSHRALRSAVAALHKYKSLQQESRVDKQAIRDLMEQYDRKMRIKDQDIKTSRAIEENLLEEIHTIDDKWRSQVERLEAEAATLRSTQPRALFGSSESLNLSRADRSQTPNASSPTQEAFTSQGISTQLQGPSDISRSQSQSYPYFPPSDMSRAHNVSNPFPAPPDMSRMRNLSNPLPEPPRPVSPERLASLSRSPVVAGSSDNRRTASKSSSRISIAQTISDSQSSFTGRSRFEDPHTRRDRTLRSPVLVPGAPSMRKVVPPRPAPPETPMITPGRTWNPLQSPAPRVPPPEASPSNGSVHMRQEHDEQGRTVYYQYGWIPDRGYAWFQVPHSSPSQASVRSNGTAGPSHAAAATSTTSGTNARGRSIYEQPIIEDNSRPEAGSPSPRPHRDRVPSSRSSRRQASSTAIESEQPEPAPAQHSQTSTRSSASLSGMALLNVPPLSSGTVSSAADRQDIMNILGVNTPQMNHAQVSPATTWGTVHSSQVPSRASNNPSHNPSVSDLGLVGLPEPATLVGSSDEGSQSDSSVGDDSDSIDRDEFMTPRSRPLSYGRSVASPEHIQPAQTTQGMGILLDAGRQPASQIIGGPQELQVVTESLMRLVDEGQGQGSRGHYHRSERFASTPNPRDPPEAILGARTGVPLYSSRPQSIRPDVANGLSSRSHSGSAHRLDREYMSDSEHAHNRAAHAHHHSQSRHRSSRRQSSLSGEAVIPPPPVTAPSTYQRQPSAPSRVSEREPRSAHFESPAYASAPREHRTHSSAPASATDANASQYSLTSLSGSNGGLLLSFTPVAGGSSSAVSITGQESGIRAPAPRPISSRQSSLLGGPWNARSGR